jgi:integrase
MPRSCPSQIRYGRGTINPTAYNSFACLMIVDGVRHRANKRTIEEARAWLDMIEDQTAANRPPLTNVQLGDAARALAILPPGFTLTDAAKALAGSQNQSERGPVIPIAQAAEAFLKKRKPFLRPRTYGSYETTVNRFGKMGYGAIQDVRKEHVEEFVAGMNPENRNSILRRLNVFFAWCRDQEWIDQLPTDKKKVPRAKVSEPAKEILTVEDVEKVLRQAEADRKDLVAYLAVGFFTGIRSAEMARLRPERLKTDFVSLIGEVTKKHRNRTVRIRPNLRAWLDRYPVATLAPLSEGRRFEAIRKLCTAAGVAWKSNCMRHSFASYGYEETGGDANGIAAEMGEKDVGVFFRSYRGLVAPGDGKRYFSIMPKPASIPS